MIGLFDLSEYKGYVSLLVVLDTDKSIRNGHSIQENKNIDLTLFDIRHFVVSFCLTYASVCTLTKLLFGFVVKGK